MMKTKNINILLLVIVLSCAFLFQSCTPPGSSPCGPQSINYYYINATDKALIPYKGTDTIKLQCNGGQIATFIGQGKDSSFDKIFAGTADCPSTAIHNRQYYTTKYACSNYSLPLLVNLSFPTSDYTSYLSVTFDNKVFMTPVYDLSVIQFQKNIIINGKQYFGYGMISSNNNTDTIYFSKDYGIVKMILNGNSWTIVP